MQRRPAKAVEAGAAETVEGPRMTDPLGQGGRLVRSPGITSVKTRMAPTPLKRSY